MSKNLFSVSEDGYTKKEVEDYLLYLQTKFTKTSMQNEEYKKLETKLTQENRDLIQKVDELSLKNKELYTDCVKFAKRLKVKDLEMEKLKDRQLELEKSLLDEKKITSKLRQDLEKIEFDKSSEQKVDETTLDNDKLDEKPVIITDEVLKNQEKEKPVENNKEEIKSDDFISDFFDEEKPEKVKGKSKAKNIFLTFLQIIFSLLFICLILFDAITAVSFAMTNGSKDKYLLDRRAYVVQTEENSPHLQKNDIVVLKLKDKADIKNGKYIFYKNNQNIEGLFKITDSSNINKNMNFKVSSNLFPQNTVFYGDTSFLSTVEYVIPKLGIITNFAYENQILFILIIVLLTIINFLILLLLPLLKKKKNN
ncbi:MAG: hypothetical protein Q4E28_04795 [Clostridia bacterium]|nr:hypothetical protein [Clostridia bacterium]